MFYYAEMADSVDIVFIMGYDTQVNDYINQYTRKIIIQQVNMSNSEIRTILLHLRDSDDHDNQKLLQYADFRIHLRNLAKATGSVRF